MASTPEGKVKDKVKKLLAGHIARGHVYVHWPVQAGYGAPTLDAIGCANGRFFAIETKAPGKKPTERQLYTISEMEKTGARVFVIGEHCNIPDLDHPEGYQSAYPYSGMADLEAWLLKLLP